ncbi:MAG: hypothetical protein H0V92_00595 [Pseudonocardiales bacterium]|nr:hypothetical protein [Pseudonocardiales bacterium]
MQKRSVVAGSVAFATAGSAMFGGVALAGNCDKSGGDDNSSYSHNSYGGDGKGGTATNNCLNVGVPILSGIGILGQGDAGGASCNASADGTGGAAY